MDSGDSARSRARRDVDWVTEALNMMLPDPAKFHVFRLGGTWYVFTPADVGGAFDRWRIDCPSFHAAIGVMNLWIRLRTVEQLSPAETFSCLKTWSAS